MCTVCRSCHLDKKWHEAAWKCGVGSVVHRRRSDRSHSDVAVLCAGVSVSWARPTQPPNESWVSRRIWQSVPSFCFAVVNLSETRKYVQAELVQASLPTRTNQLHVNPRDSIPGFLQSRFTNNDQRNRLFAQLWPGNEVRGIAGENRLRCVCFSFELLFFFCFGMLFSDHSHVPRCSDRDRASPSLFFHSVPRSSELWFLVIRQAD